MSIYKNVINYVETEDGIEKVEENVNDILLRKDNQYKDWLCWSGIYTLSISPDGSIYNATCANNKMGNIFEDDEINLYTEPHVCKRSWCACAADLNIKKVKNEKFIDLVRKERIIPKLLEVELTNRCNLKCPMCFRNQLDLKRKVDIDIDLFDKFDLSKIKKVDICGTISEQTFHPRFFDFIDKFSSDTAIAISTSGNTHDAKWWKKLGHKLNEHKDSFVIFALDGLEDTHSIYRIGSNFNKVIENIKAFNESGAESYAQFIIFKHNQHQMEDVKKLSYELGCKKFLMRTSSHYNEKLERPDIIDVKTRHELCDSKKEKEVRCKHLDKESVFIDYNGNVFPCCFFIKCKYLNLDKYKEESELFEKYKDQINLYENSLDKILESEFYSSIYKKYKDFGICKSFCRFEGKEFFKKME